MINTIPLFFQELETFLISLSSSQIFLELCLCSLKLIILSFSFRKFSFELFKLLFELLLKILFLFLQGCVFIGYILELASKIVAQRYLFEKCTGLGNKILHGLTPSYSILSEQMKITSTTARLIRRFQVTLDFFQLGFKVCVDILKISDSSFEFFIFFQFFSSNQLFLRR